MRHRDGILNYYDHKITSARIEVTNTKTEEYLKLKILALHESKRSYAAWVKSCQR
jgi:hypothetical protein